MTDQKTVAVVGLGFVGMRVARDLSGDKRIKVVAIDPKLYFEDPTAAIHSLVDPSGLDHSLIDYSINPTIKDVYKQGLVTAIFSDGTKGELTLQTGEKISFDYAVIGTGSSYGGIKAPPGTLTAKTERVEVFSAQLKAISDAESIVIVGASSVGVEVAAYIAETFPGKSVTLIASGTRVLEAFDKKASEYAAKWLVDHGVNVVYGDRVTQLGNTVEEFPVQSSIKTDKGTTYCGLVYKCIGAKPNSSTFSISSSLKLNSKGAILVDPTLQVEGFANVFAAGDVAATAEEKTANYADYAGQTVSRNIKALLNGQELIQFPQGLFKGQGKLPFACGTMLGKKDGILQTGTADVQTGGSVAKIKGFIGRVMKGYVQGSWFYSWLYGVIKAVFSGQLAGVAKKEAAAAVVDLHCC